MRFCLWVKRRTSNCANTARTQRGEPHLGFQRSDESEQVGAMRGNERGVRGGRTQSKMIARMPWVCLSKVGRLRTLLKSWMEIHACERVCVRVCVCARVCKFVCGFVVVRLCGCVYVYTYTDVYVYVHVCTCMHVYVYACVHLCVYIHASMYEYIQPGG